MKLYFPGLKPDYSPREHGRLARFTLWPDSNGPKIKPLRLLIDHQIDELHSGDTIRITDVDGVLIIRRPRPGVQDDRVAFLVDAYKVKHRVDATVLPDSTAKPYKASYGYGAWGAGFVALVILKPGERFCYHASGGYYILENVEGHGVRRVFSNRDDYTIALRGDNEGKDI